jgi:YidC/Oxa1 family membrane protein insertase
MKEIYHVIFYQPIFNLLIGLYDVIPGKDIGIAIILLTVIVKAVMWPLSVKMLKSQKALADMQPKVEALKAQYKDKQEEMAKALMALYSQEKVNPASSCLPVLIQLPVFIALYGALSHGLKSSGFDALYPFIANPGTINPTFLGLVDLAKPSAVLAILAGITQYFQAKQMVTRQQPKGTPGAKDEEMLAAMNKQMVYVMPVLTVMLGWTLPGGLGLYWFVMNVLTVGQQWYFFREKKKA